MATLPTTGDDLDLISFVVETQPSYTHKLDTDSNRVRGMTDDQDAVLQAVYLILNVERYAFPIYSRNYGSELSDGWEFEKGRNWVRAHFIAHTIYGDISATKEVDV